MATDAQQEETRPVFMTRGYQQELLEESLRRNVIIALDTGSGKTHIAMLRMKHEVEHNSKKISWFLAPTVALIEQQRDVIASSIPVSVGLISGAREPDQWKNAALWSKVLAEHRIMISTPQILLDALRHGYIQLGRDISLLVFDEAHHATSKHPYNEIMKGFYRPLPPREGRDAQSIVRPAILGLTASPIYGGDIGKAFREIEGNLDSVIRSSRFNRDELSTFVHRPEFRFALYTQAPTTDSRLLTSLRNVVSRLDIENDPHVITLRSQLATLPPGEQRNRVDQRLSRMLVKEDTFTHKGLRDFERTATDICAELGPWAADWYIHSILELSKAEASLHSGVMASWQDREKRYLLDVISRIHLEPVSNDPEHIRAGISPKVHELLKVLRSEERDSRTQEDPFSGIIFVTRRDAVLTLAKILSTLPEMTERFQTGCLLGTSNSFKRHSFLDISRSLLQDTATQTLKDFKTGEKNLVVSTAVAEEGIDIQACGTVIRFDPPPNMVAWAQSRGRARRQRSTFIVMLGNDPDAADKLHQWAELEREMVAFYTDPTRENEPVGDDILEEDEIEFVVEQTGAKLTLDSAISHLTHFCAVLPHTSHAVQAPLFDLDPPDYEEGWHSTNPRHGVAPYSGPWGAIVTLPRQVDQELRKHSTSCVYPTKRSARNHVAFFAYHRLYRAGLLNDHLLPLTSVVEPDQDGAVKLLLDDIEKRAGLTNSTVQYDPWLASQDADTWWYNEIAIQGLPRLFMFTRRQLDSLSDDELPVLHVPGQGDLKVDIRSLAEEVEDASVISAAKEYTRRMFASLHEKRMDMEKLDFAYLFLPMDGIQDGAEWQARREWMQDRLANAPVTRAESALRANADALGKKFAYPLNIAAVRSNDKYDKILRFVGWHDGPLSPEEEEEFLERYEGEDITYPLLIAQEFPRRVNFLHPLDSAEAGQGDVYPFVLHPQYATVELVSHAEVQYAFLLPSVLRFVSIAATVHATRATLFSSSPRLASIPFSLLKTALTAPVSQEAVNYQRLETLGDTVLKFIVSNLLYSQYPLWHEGYLARRKDHAVNNTKLAKEALRVGVEKWVVRDRFVPRKWRPRYTSDKPAGVEAGPSPNPESSDAVQPAASVDPEVESKTTQEAEQNGVSTDAQPDGATQQESVNAVGDAAASSKKGKKKKQKGQSEKLSIKMVADVVESLLGAAYEHGGFDLAIECAELFELGIKNWEKIPACVETSLARVEALNELPPELDLVEQMLGYQFEHRTLLVEALTHASYTGDYETQSYERLEFLGDAVLDMIVTDFLFHAPGKNYTPGHMHIRKESLVNSHLLAFICMNTFVDIDASMPAWNAQDGVVLTTDTQRIHLYRCLLHSSPRVLDDLNVAFSRWERSGGAIQRALEEDSIYPWAALTSLQAPKFISDMLESILGAIFLDAHGDLDVIRRVLRKLGIMAVMERIVADDVDVLHPVSRLAIWAAKNQREWAIKSERLEGDISCYVLIDDVEEFRATEPFRGKASQNEVRFAAAEGAIRKLHVIEEETPKDVDELEWPDDVPEYDW